MKLVSILFELTLRNKDLPSLAKDVFQIRMISLKYLILIKIKKLEAVNLYFCEKK